MSKNKSLDPLIVALVVFSLYFFSLLPWSQDTVYERPTSVFTAIGLTVGELMYFLVLLAEFRMTDSKARRVGIVLMLISLLLLLSLNWIGGHVSALVAVVTGSCAALLVLLGALIWWRTWRQPKA